MILGIKLMIVIGYLGSSPFVYPYWDKEVICYLEPDVIIMPSGMKGNENRRNSSND